MENEKELETYINNSKHRLIISNDIDEIQKLKEQVNKKYIDLYNNKSASDAEFIGLTELKSKIEEKEMEIQMSKLLKDNINAMEESKKTLDNAIKLLEILEK